MGRSKCEWHRDCIGGSEVTKIKVLMFVFANQLTKAAASHRLTLSGVTNSNTWQGCCRHQIPCDSCDNGMQALIGFHRSTQFFSSVKWCYLNPLLVPPALRHDPHNSARTCARLPTRNSVKHRDTSSRTALTVPLDTDVIPEFTLVLRNREEHSKLSFFLFLISFLVQLLFSQYLDGHCRIHFYYVDALWMENKGFLFF